MFVEKMQPTYAGVELTDTMETGCDRYGREIKERDVCPLPFITLGVLPNGDVQPCDNLYKPVILGNVHETSIVTMWNGDLLRNFRKQQLRGDRKKNPMCALCCAPNDVSHPEDVLDDDALEVLKKLK